MTEAQIQALILRELTRDPGVRLFRNNQGLGWAGQVLTHNAEVIVLGNPRPLHAGLHTGAGDLIGWCRGRFLSIEVKSPTGRPTEDQINWRRRVLAAGGIAGIVRSVDEARALISP